MSAEAGTVTADLSRSILQHAAAACNVSPSDVVAGRATGRVLEARKIAIWVTARLFRDWNNDRIGRSFNRSADEVETLLLSVRRRRQLDLEWRAKGDRVLSRVLMGKQPEPQERPKSGEEPLTENDIIDRENWGFKDRWTRERFAAQNEKFARAMLAAGYPRTGQ